MKRYIRCSETFSDEDYRLLDDLMYETFDNYAEEFESGQFSKKEVIDIFLEHAENVYPDMHVTKKLATELFSHYPWKRSYF